ncbi:MAG: hypothetical protein IJ348_03525 [Alistipes sp.]|nr:hypothetical protein [Alistipes sp.]
MTVKRMNNILSTPGLVQIQHSPDSVACECDLFADTIPEYDEGRGYFKIKNPGWIKIQLRKACEISYIRFLLWDNRGTIEKRQPSNRKYTYRLLIAEASKNSTPISTKTQDTDSNRFTRFLTKCKGIVLSLFKQRDSSVTASTRTDNIRNGDIVWTAVYENSLNPTNGWQEFYFEDGVKSIVAIKIQVFQNTSASSAHKNFTHLVSIQAYKEPTRPIKQLLCDNKCVADDENCAPLPTFGFIRNRVILGGEQEVMNNLVEDEIIHKVTTYIKGIEAGYPDLQYLRRELERGSNNNTGRNDIEKQIHIFNRSILKPIEAYDNKLSRRFLRYTIITVILSVFGIIKEIVDIIYVPLNKTSPLSIDFILNFFFGE